MGILEATPDNEPHAVAMRDALQARGLIYSVWDPTPKPGRAADIKQRFGSRSYCAQAEEANDWVKIASEPADGPRAIVTTRVGLDAAGAAALYTHGYAFLTECYLSSGPTFTPELQDYELRKLIAAGLGRSVDDMPSPMSQPVVGLYGGKTLADYPTRGSYPRWWAWSAEYMWPNG